MLAAVQSKKLGQGTTAVSPEILSIDIFQPSRGICISSSRRFVSICCTNSFKIITGIRGERDQEIVPGDLVEYRLDLDCPGEEVALVSKILPRINILKRSYGRKTKLLSANITELWIVTAPPPLFNPGSLNRILAAAYDENIPTYIVANKLDLNKDQVYLDTLSYYKKVSSGVISVSAKTGENIETLLQHISSKAIQNITITGMSGVGKSSIINSIIGDQSIRTGDLSRKTGQGKQTTSSALGHIVSYKENLSLKLLIDLPGIQSFGVSHLSLDRLSCVMPDIAFYAASCRFRDCRHLEEPDCQVQNACDTGELPLSRLQSYREIHQELLLQNSF